MKECKADKRRREIREILEQDPAVARRSSINWYESELLVKHHAPEEPTTAGDVAEYLDEVERYACAVLKDLGIDEPAIPLSIEQRNMLHDPEYFEETADGTVAVKLLENVRFLKSLRDAEAPTRNQIDCMLWMMAEISALTSMPYLNNAVLLRAKAEKHRADRPRNKRIRELRAQGAKISVLEKIYAPVYEGGKLIKPGLSKRQIQTIVNKK